MQFILHIFDKLQLEQVPKKNRFISRDYDDAKEAWEGYKEKFPTITDQLFTGMYQKNVHCKGCGNVNKVFENFNYIWLGLEADNLKHAYNNYVQDTTVYEPGSLKCKACRERPETVITKEIIKLPKYCIFLFNRFDYENDCKNNKFINYPETLDLSDMYDRNMTYELLSISIHSGGLHGGHYTAVGKKDSTWVKFNDSITRIIRKSQVQNKQAYVLFYKRDGYIKSKKHKCGFERTVSFSNKLTKNATNLVREIEVLTRETKDVNKDLKIHTQNHINHIKDLSDRSAEKACKI